MDKRISLGKMAQMIMDAYYRDYPSDDEFFSLPHFAFIGCTAYAKIMNDTFMDDKMKNKDSDGFSYVNISGPWLITETCKISYSEQLGMKYLETKMPCFCFDVDAMCSSIHSIMKKPGTKCGDIQRLSNKDWWKIPHLPVTNDIFFYQLGEKILLPNLKCDPGDMIVNYIPALLPDNENCSVPETMQAAIITTSLQIMFGAKNETMTVKMANNSNANYSPGTEIAPEQMKQVQQNQ